MASQQNTNGDDQTASPPGVSPADYWAVEELLGRKPQGHFSIAVRSSSGQPVVIENAPLMDDGRPMPTRYWLLDKDLVKAIGRLESEGGVNQAQAEVDPRELEACHQRHHDQRNGLLPPSHTGPKPYGGVGGTRIGVKCLHAHYANYLVTGEDPVGEWVEQKLLDQKTQDPTDRTDTEWGKAHYRTVANPGDGPTLVIHLGQRDTWYVLGGVGSEPLVWRAELTGTALTTAYFEVDPPRPGELSAALSIVELHITDALRELPPLGLVLGELAVIGTGDAALLAAIELGVEESALDPHHIAHRADLEDLFRTIASESKADRAHNPGLPPTRVDDIVGTMCVLIETMRQLTIDQIRIHRSGESAP